MLSLSPAKILVILVVALLVLGPDKLPGVARQIGAVWHDLRKLRTRLETEVRGAFPDLPSPQQVAQAVRSPLSYLDGLADKHAAGLGGAEGTGDAGAGAATGANGNGPAAAPGGASGAGPPGEASAGTNGATSTEGAAGAAADPRSVPTGAPGRAGPQGPAAGSSAQGWADGLGEFADDPSMN